ncbi:LppX_LprAFG lipoprotein [Mycolicibacterium septicum]|uniref:LppX_LprAFG lipoprotein n=1 Tax=Mycolicibacterium septicum TaxID=98668 RepID=UPI001AF90667|nr:LppX_LprAFG lipoprotein [Mycolicibacterium septicum]QRY49660.1 LppX_LprAFG lipoprotein [Mycolicibacterium septicum]
MQTRPRFAVQSLLAILFAAAALVAGCSSSSSSEKSNAPLPDATQLLQESAASTKAQQSVHLLLTVQGTIKGLPVEKLDGDLTNTPEVAAEGTADLLFAGQKLADAKFVVAGGDLYAALTPGDPLSNYGPATNIYDISAILNPDNGLANVLANFSDPKADGRESVGGTEAVRVTGTVSADAVNKIAPQLKAEGPVPGTAWITEDGNHTLLQAKLEPTPGNSVTMTLSDWGKQVTVTKPAS